MTGRKAKRPNRIRFGARKHPGELAHPQKALKRQHGDLDDPHQGGENGQHGRVFRCPAPARRRGPDLFYSDIAAVEVVGHAGDGLLDGQLAHDGLAHALNGDAEHRAVARVALVGEGRRCHVRQIGGEGARAADAPGEASWNSTPAAATPR
jgi:hypothetical protein